MNNLGDTSFNKRNLLKQGIGVNLYPLPFAKGGSLPKAQFGQKLSRKAQRSKARSIAKRDLDLNLWQRRKKYGDSALENMAEAALSIVPNPAAQAARAALKSNDIAYNIQQSEHPGVQAAIEGVSMLPVFPKALRAQGKTIIPGVSPISEINRNNRQVLSSLFGLGARGFENAQSVADLAGGVPDEQDNPALPFLPDRRRPSIQQGVPMRFIRQERRKLLRQQSPAEKSRMRASPFAYGGSMPGYQGGGAMPELNSGMLDEVSITSGFNPMNDPGNVSPAPLQYNTRGIGMMPRVPLGIPSSGPAIRSGVPVAPAAPAAPAPRVKNTSSGPRTTGGGYRYGAGFFGDKGRPASNSITRRPNVRTKFYEEGGEIEAFDMDPDKRKPKNFWNSKRSRKTGAQAPYRNPRNAGPSPSRGGGACATYN